jgi:hypothetical protein
MIKFRTEVNMPVFKKKMGYRNQSMMIGSCFAENIGTYLHELCLPVMVNPFGVLYNPVSIANSLRLLLSDIKFTEKDLFYCNGLYHSFSHHSRFSGSDPVATLRGINLKINEASDRLKNCQLLLVTFGTSWVFEHKLKGIVVSNCHKLPGATFKRYSLSVAQITEDWIQLIDQLRCLNPDLHVIFTVSPIRHLSDGAHQNQLSKATLLLAIEDLISRYGDEVVSYFPAYEVVLDELRDYRFYATDMTHPSEVAVDFIREKFAAAILDTEALKIISELNIILPALKHKIMNSKDERYQSYIGNQIEKAHQLQTKYPFVDLESLIKKLLKKSVD